LDKLQTTDKRKGDGENKEESHAIASRRNKIRGKKNVNFSII